MFLTLLLVTFVLAVVTSAVVERAMRKPVSRILTRIVADLADAYGRYISLGLYVMGIAWGAPVNRLAYYLDPGRGNTPTPLDMPHAIIEGYRTIIDTMEGVTSLLLAFFVVTMIAYVIVRRGETKVAEKRAAYSIDTNGRPPTHQLA